MGIHSVVSAIPIGYGVVAQKTHDDDTMIAAIEWVATTVASESDNIVEVRIKFGETEGGIKYLFSYNGPARAALTAVRRLRATDYADAGSRAQRRSSVLTRRDDTELGRNATKRIAAKGFHGIDY